MSRVKLKTVVMCILFFLAPTLMSQNFETWIVQQRKIAIESLIANIEPSGTYDGTVIASPSCYEPPEPNYYFDWIRDGAIAMMEVVKLYERALSSEDKDEHLQRVLRYVKAARARQSTASRSGPGDKHGLGEPKWHVNNTPFNDDWGRPQNDGPALRALTLTYFAQALLREGKRELVKTLYSTRGTRAVINIDLDFIAMHWHEPSYELWEEVNGLHFSTLLQQRRALLAGAELARTLDDFTSVKRYESAIILLSRELGKFWDNNRGHFVQTHGRVGGLDYKHSNVDASIILAILDENELLLPHDDRVLSTAEFLRAQMHSKHDVNRRQEFDNEGIRMGDGIGRYIEDRYNGKTTTDVGNPWFLITAAFAELNYRVAQNFIKDGVIKVSALNSGFLRFATRELTQSLELGETILKTDERFSRITHALLVSGDSYLRRWRFHAAEDGSTSEQFNGFTGFMQGAEKLTWNNAAFLSAFREREKLTAMLVPIPIDE